jgi:predicted permease
MRPEHWIYTIPLRLRSLFWRREADQELDEELRYHVECKTEEHIARGMTPQEARRAAMLEIGGVEKRKEECRDTRRVNWIQDLLQDVRYGLRMLRKSPGFTVVAVLTLALGIGANTAIFNVAYGILLKSLPYPHSSRILQIWVEGKRPEPYRIAYASRREFEVVRQQSHAFEQVAFYDEGGVTIIGGGPPESVQASTISGNFFAVLGTEPLLGRPILPGDMEPGHNQVAVISYALWQERFGGDPGIIGRAVLLQLSTAGTFADRANEARPYIVVGVLPSLFPFPNLGEVLTPPDPGWVLTQMIAIARLKQGTTLERANTELHTIAARLSEAYPEKEKDINLSAGTLRDRLTEDYRTKLLILLAAASFVLLLACVNVSGLLIARSWARQREVAIRATLGATRLRLLRQFLLESVLLAFLGGALGLLFAHWGSNFLLSIAPAETPRLDEIGIDRWVLAYVLAISCIGGMLFGLAPALQMTETGPGAALKEGGAPFTGFYGTRRQGLQSMLVVGEIALAFVLVVGSMLVIRSFSKLTSVRMGYRLDHILTMWVSFSRSGCPNLKACKTTADEVLQGTRSIPGVESAAFGVWRPMSTTFGALVLVEGRPETDRMQLQMASPGYFETLGVPLLAGRAFAGTDRENSPLVTVVNQSMAKSYFEGSPLGKRISWRKDEHGERIWIEVVGLVGDTRDDGPSQKTVPAFYIPISQAEFLPETTLLVRTSANPLSISHAIKEQVWAVDRNAPVSNAKTMDQVMSDRVAEPRFHALLLSAFGGLGLLLAVVGVYGVISYSAAQRTHEIGVRMAMGALPRDVAGIIVGEAGLLTSIGIAIGVGGALALGRFLQSLLFQVKPTDPATFVVVAFLLAATALLASYVPARRAMRVDPMVALRHE